MTDTQVKALAERFWRLAPDQEPFPRSLEAAILWRLPLGIVKLPHLGILVVLNWLNARHVEFPLESKDRSLSALIVAGRGTGLIFLDGNDPLAEQRYSLAHELAHFLLDYFWPHQKTVKVMGPAVKEVLDGRRPATHSERLTAVLRRVRLDTFIHLLERNVDGRIVRTGTLCSEDDADRLALELLAPLQEVMGRAQAHRISWHETTAEIETARLLQTEFGFPHAIAARYGTYLAWGERNPRSFRDWLGK